jgi:hypothetical protein
MTTTHSPGPSFDPPPDSSRAIDSRKSFREQLVHAVVGAAIEGRREIVWVDPDFADWPLDEARVLDAMTRWARRPQRRFLMLASHYDAVPRRHPRFTQWRRTWSHRIDCRVASPQDVTEMPTLMLAGDLYSLQLISRDPWRGRWFADEGDQRAWREVVDAILQRSEGGFAANVLGL